MPHQCIQPCFPHTTLTDFGDLQLTLLNGLSTLQIVSAQQHVINKLDAQQLLCTGCQPSREATKT